MMHQYLSPEWSEAAQPIRDRYVATHDAPDEPIIANVTVTGVPFGDGALELHSLPGVPNVFDPGHVDEPDVSVTIDYGLARMVVLDPSTNVLELGINAGQVVIDGDTAALTRYWRTHIGDDGYVRMMDELRSITR